MKRPSKLLIAALAVWTLAAMLACNNGQQNNNKPDNDTNANVGPNPPPPTPIPPAVACAQVTPADRASMVTQSLIQHINRTGGKLNDEYTATPYPKFAFRAVVFPPGPNPGDPVPDALIMVIGGSISGKNIFPALNGLLAPYMAQDKCVMRVVFVPTIAEVPPTFTVASLNALPGGFGWSGCEYPLVACPSGMCADAGSCSGGIDKSSTAAPAPGAPAPAVPAAKTGPASKANGNGNTGPPANRP